MFERTNQSILTPHYTALIAKDTEDDDNDVFTLARRDHDIDESIPSFDPDSLDPTATASIGTPAQSLVPSEDLSKRKLKAGTSRRGILKNRPAPEKVVFDDEGKATDFYKAGEEAEVDAAGDRIEFEMKERERMKEADRVDREVARERKREMKRKRKDRERVRVSTSVVCNEGFADLGH
jgi:ATP-dependent RNA helicase DDX10/DBP4